ncbi:MAG TPA: hypothetical protein PKI05_15240, partial [Thermogutta sp.]|nr:hypothetical protein [Thermogutta sp.]
EHGGGRSFRDGFRAKWGTEQTRSNSAEANCRQLFGQWDCTRADGRSHYPQIGTSRRQPCVVG